MIAVLHAAALAWILAGTGVGGFQVPGVAFHHAAGNWLAERTPQDPGGYCCTKIVGT